MFACRSCGHCCQNLRAALVAAEQAGPVIQGAGMAFTYAVRPDGSCSQLRADNTCAVYANRPLFCNVDAIFDALAQPDLTREMWHDLNAAACPPA